MDEGSASFLDKTDWRQTLHRKLEACVNAEGTVYFIRNVKSLIRAYSAEYPGWNAKEDLEKFINRLDMECVELKKKWYDENSSAKRWKKYQFDYNLVYTKHDEIFEYIKNKCASKRMLLWGTKKVTGGTQIPYDD